MQNKKKKKRSITLIEMIVVMVLIATISGAIAYNYKKSLNEGKAFKSKEAMGRIKNALELEILRDANKLNNISTEWKTHLKDCALVPNNGVFCQDGWGVDFKVEPDGQGGVTVSSDKLKAYLENK